MMTENKKELISIIRENDKPDEAFMIAFETIVSFLMPHESSQAQSSADLQVSG